MQHHHRLKVNFKITIYGTGEVALVVKTTALTEDVDLVPSTQLVACNSLTLISDDKIPLLVMRALYTHSAVISAGKHPCIHTKQTLF